MIQESQAAQLASQALALYNSGSFAEADRLYAQALQLEPDNSEILVDAGRLHVDRGKFTSGLDYLLAAQAAGEKRPEMHLAIGIACNSLGRYEQATLALRRCIAARSDWVPAWSELGFALSAQEQHLEAVLLLGSVVRETPTPEAYFDMGSALYAAGRMVESTTAFDAAMNLQADKAKMYFGLARAMLWPALNREEEAIGFYQTGLEIEPTNHDARIALNRLLTKRQTPRETAPRDEAKPRAKGAKRHAKGRRL